MPLTEQGFQRLTYDDILTMQIERAKLLFGDDIDTSEQSTFGKILRLYCLDASENQEIAEKVYLSAFPNTASGVSLDRLCPLAGISRNPATYAQHEITITGTAGAVIEMGFLVSAGDVVFHTVNSYTIGTDGTAIAVVECNDSGTIGNVALGSITDIVNPNADITSIQHTAIEKLAVDMETDYELRTRFSQSLSGSGSGTLDSIRGAVLRVSGVQTVEIIENETSETVDGMPPHSFQCYVLAPESAKNEIAQAIFDVKPLGIWTWGTTDAYATDDLGKIRLIRFSFTEEVPIYIKFTIETNDSYSADTLATIKNNIVQKLSSYTNGQGVTVTSLYGSIYTTGVEDVTGLMIGTSAENYSTDTISIATNQVARTSIANIEVTVNE